MFDDGCKKDFGAVAVFEKSGCQRSYFWYDLNKMANTTEPAVTHADPKKSLGGTGQAWCVAPFNPTVGLEKGVGSFQLWGMSPEGVTLEMGLSAY